MKIISCKAREILDSRGNPTVRAWVEIEGGYKGNAGVPSGASAGAHEALEIRDGDEQRYGGKGVLKAVANVNDTIAKEVVGKSYATQRALDDALLALDGTENKLKLGANAILAVSLAFASAVAAGKNLPLYASIREQYGKGNDYGFPEPMMNVINGGAHADNGLAIQEYLIIPHAATMRERVRQGEEVFHALKKVLHERGLSTSVGDEGGFAPKLENDEAAFVLIVEAIIAAGYKPREDVSIGIDAAASEFYNAEKKMYTLSDRELSAGKLTMYYKELVEKYPLISIEDGLAEDDWESWEKHTTQLGGTVQLVGDDLFVTNPKRVQDGIDRKVANSVLIKLNQIGTLTETLDCIALAKDNGYTTAVSHRSGETSDTFMADLTVAVAGEYIKTSCSRSERTEKYNRLMEIEDELRHKNALI